MPQNPATERLIMPARRSSTKVMASTAFSRMRIESCT